MLNRLQFYYDIITKSELFQKDLYLTSCFAIDNDWQLDFYSKKTKKVTSFVVQKKEAKILNENSKIFQKENVHLKELKLKKIAIDFDEAMEKTEKIKQELCPSDKINKTIKILQTLKTPIWNITFITNNFNVLNVKINAQTGDILTKSCTPAFSFRDNTKQ